MKSVMRVVLCVVMLVGMLGWSALLPAQSSPNLENGWKPYGSYDGTHLDTVNLMNGNLMLHLPLVPDVPQRGAVPLGEVLFTTSKDWQAVCGTIPNGQIACSWKHGATQFQVQPTVGVSVQRAIDTVYVLGTLEAQSAFNYVLVTNDGATHQLQGVAGSQDANGVPTKYDTFDLTGYHLEMSNPDANGVPGNFTVTDRHGVQYQSDLFHQPYCGKFPSTNRLPQSGEYASMIDDSSNGGQTCQQFAYANLVTDSNGNQINLTPYQQSSAMRDTLGRVGQLYLSGPVFNGNDSTGCVGSHPFQSSVVLYYVDPNGVTQSIKECFSTINLQTAFNQTSPYGGLVSEFNSVALNQPAAPLTTVILADGTKWTFDYDSYGKLIFIGLPTGGSITYTWTTINFTNCSPNDPTAVSRAVASRTLNDGQGHTQQWNYNWGTATSSGLTNVVTDPLGNDTVHIFTQQTTAGGNPPPGCFLYETSTIDYQGSQSANHPLQRVDTTYSSGVFAGSSGAPAVGNVFATDILTTVYPSGKVKKVHRDPDAGLGAGQPIFGNVKKELEYDWGQGAPGALLRETDTTYQWEVNSAYLTARMLDLPSSVVVKDGSGNRVAETDYSYDEAAYLTGTTISTQHAAPPYSVRGNQTTVSRWLNTTNSFIVSHTDWYDTGEVYKQIDPLGHQTTHSYDAAYIGGYSTQTCSPTSGGVAHCVSGTYDFNTGVLTSLTNENATTQASGTTPGDSAHTSNYSYDLMFRLTSAQAPPDPLNGNLRAQNTFNFSTPNIFPVTVQRTKSVTTTLSDSGTSSYDGLGRVFKTQHALPNGTATVDTTFDLGGHVATVSNPYFTTSDLTYGTITNQYDGLDRVNQTTKQDGSISTVAYSVIAGAHDAVPGANYAGDCTDSFDEAGKQRRGCTDALGRLVEVNEPNSAAPATTATGSLTINGSEQTLAVGTSGSGSVTISGNESQICVVGPCPPHALIWDQGTVSISVNGVQKSVNYSHTANTNFSQIAAALRDAFHTDTTAPADASCTDQPCTSGVIRLTARSAGASTNYSLLVTISSTYTGYAAAVSGSTLTGGMDPASDSGSLTATVNGTNYTVTFGAGDTGTSIASRLATAINGSTVVTASASGNQINLVSRTVGAAGNATLSTSYTWNSSTFSQASFTATASGVAGGYDAGQFDNAPYKTLYKYDALGNLLRVDQKGSAPTDSSQWRTRTFTYDSLSRLLTATNPESGTITNTYDNDGNLLQKISPAPNQTNPAITQTVSYCYDELHRVTGKGYGAQSCPLTSPVVSYAYDSGTNAKGHLTQMTDQAGTASYGYDILGRLATETRSLVGANNGAVSKTLSYEYNLDGSLSKLHYPSGAVVTNTPDSAGRVLSAVDGGSGINYVSSATYGPDSSLTGFISGSGGSSSITNKFLYTPRLQPCRMAAATNGTLPGNCLDSAHGNVLDLGYDFHAGNGTPGSGTDNGNIFGITNYKDSNRSQTFTYDTLNRVITAQNAGTNCATMTVNNKTEYWGNSYTYDAWGNLTGKTITKCGAENLSVTTDAHNWLHISPNDYQYDVAGNMTHDATSGLNYSFDQENRITGTNGYTYTYDGDGNRVRKSNGNLAANGTLYWYMTPGIVAESDLAGTLKSEYVFFDGERVARKDFPGNTVAYYFSDHLKTASVITDSTGTIKADSDYYPWGGELQFVNNDSNHFKYGGHEHDSESNLEYYGARYYGNGLSRFITPDWSAAPVPVPYADLNNPQTLNQYAYVHNNPMSYGDPDGHCCDLQYAWDFGAGAVRGVVSSASFGLVGAPKAGDSQASLLGQSYGTFVEGMVGAGVMSKGAGDAGAGLVLAPETGGASLVVSGGGLVEMGAGAVMEAGATKNAAAIMMVAKNSGSGGTNSSQDRTSADELRRDANGRAVPDPEAKGNPHTQLGTRQSKSRPGTSYRQAREFDANGKPVKDIDFTDHGRPQNHPNPHQHTYDSQTGKRNKKAEPVK